MKTLIPTQYERAACFAAVFMLLSIPAFAQLTITSDQFTQAFNLLAVSAQTSYSDTATAGLQSLVNQTGANQTWNFQGLPFMLNTAVNDESSVVPYPGGAADASSFPTATHVQISSSGGKTIYIFYEINPTGFYSLGASEDSMGHNPTIIEQFTPPLENFAFPLTYQTQWTSTSSILAGGYSETEEIDGYVDGWGSYSLPGNSSIPALRIRQKTIDTYTIIEGKDTIHERDASYSFEWFNLSAFSASIDADSNQNATDGSYSVASAPNIVSDNTPSSTFSISMASNPVSSSTNVLFSLPNDAPVQIALMDELGRQSQLLMNGVGHAGVNTLLFDPATLPNGNYFVRIESGGHSTMQKIIVNH